MFTADRSSERGPLRVRAATASALAVSFLLLAGCGGGGNDRGSTADGGDTKSPSATATANDFGCLSPEQAKTESVTFSSGPGQQDVEAFATGRGSTALILAHQADGDVCQWVPDARELAKEGYRVVAVNSAGSEVEELTAAAYVRAHGAHKVLLVGASKGGTAVLTSAGSITPPVDAVVSLSAPANYFGMDAARTVPKLTMPILYMAAEGDTDFAASTKDLSKATKKAKENVLDIVGGANHGVSMLADPDNFAKVKAFLKKYGG